jgi:hypothetical protein
VIVYRGGSWVVQRPGRVDRRVPAFVPGWAPGDSGAGRALLEVAERYVGLLADRLALAPDKARLALLGALGVSPIPARAARAPVVFVMLPGATDGRAPARTRLGARAADPAAGALEFETEAGIALASARLAEVKAVLPGGRYADFTPDVLAEQKFVLFDRGQPIPGALYVGHDRVLAVSPGSVVDVRVELAPAGAGPGVAGAGGVVWEYYDGTDWVGFVPPPAAPAATPTAAAGPPRPAAAADPGDAPVSFDGTHGLNRSGTVRLLVGERGSGTTTVRGRKGYWVRVRPVGPDPEEPSAAAPAPAVAIDRVQVSSVDIASGFRQFSAAGRPLSPRKTRQAAIALVDASGAPLPLQPPPGDAAPPASGPAGFTGYRVRRVLAAAAASPDGDRVTFDLDAGDRALTLAVEWEGVSGRTRASELTLDVPEGGLTYTFDLARTGRLAELAFAAGLKVDPSVSFAPFGVAPQPGAAFLFSCPEVFGKPGARVTVFLEAAGRPAGVNPDPGPVVRWEYWNGQVWAPLPGLEGVDAVRAFLDPGELGFTVPANMAVKKEMGQEKAWVRVVLASGGYLYKDQGEVRVPQGRNQPAVKFDKVLAPVVTRFRLEYRFESRPEAPQSCVVENGFETTDVTTRLAFGGSPVTPFVAAEETRPTLYLGFSRSLPVDLVSLFFRVAAGRGEPELKWEYWDVGGWRPLALEGDETDGLARPGLVQFLWPGTALPDPAPVAAAAGSTVRFLDARSAARYRPGDALAVFQDEQAAAGTVARVDGAEVTLAVPLTQSFNAPTAGPAPLPRFGTPRHWVRVVWPRAEVPEPGGPSAVTVEGIYLNAVWAAHRTTHQNELLGSTGGTDGEVLRFARRPVLEGEQVEVLELAGALADAEWRRLDAELKAAGRAGGPRLVRDPATGKVTAAWVRWEGRANFSGSGPDDRHYVIDRELGQIQFGDGRAGRVPPANPNNVVATYSDGGKLVGNVPARAIGVVLGSVPGAQTVFNPVAAAGGADGELAAAATATPAAGDAGAGDAPPSREGLSRALLERGPQVVRHRGRAVGADDYEGLARQASPSVALARVVTPLDSGGVVRPGRVRVVVVPFAPPTERQPTPSAALCEAVRAALAARAPAAVAGRVEVTGPDYLPVGVDAVLVPRDAERAGPLVRDAAAAAAAFLHPVVGGVDGRGWAFGRRIYRSDLALVLRRRLGDALAYVESLLLLEDGLARPEYVDVPADRLPAAGVVRVRLTTPREPCR